MYTLAMESNSHGKRHRYAQDSYYYIMHNYVKAEKNNKQLKQKYNETKTIVQKLKAKKKKQQQTT